MMLGDEQVDPQMGDVKITFVVDGKSSSATWARSHIINEFGDAIKAMQVERYIRTQLFNDKHEMREFEGWTEE